MLIWRGKGSVYLSGFMGSGKTTAARRLAASLHLPWFDTDALIEQETGLSIAEIFARYGEAHFRRVERTVVARVTRRGPAVVALGGGVVLNPENVADLKHTGLVVCLLPSVDVLWQRLKGKTNRPLLLASTEDEQRKKLVQLYRARAPVYREVADLMLEPQKERHPAVTVHEIVSWLREKGWIELSE